MRRRTHPLPFFHPSDPSVYALVRETTDRGPSRGLDLTTCPPSYEDEQFMLSPPEGYMEFTTTRGSPPTSSLAFQIASIDRNSQGLSGYPTDGRNQQYAPLALRLAHAQSRPPPRLPPTSSSATYSFAQASDRAPIPSRQSSLDGYAHAAQLDTYKSEHLWVTPMRRLEVSTRTRQMLPTRAHSLEIRAGSGPSLIFRQSQQGVTRAAPQTTEATPVPPIRMRKRRAREASLHNPQPRKK